MSLDQIEQLDGRIEAEQQDDSVQSFQRSLQEKQSEAIRECDRLIQHFQGQAGKHKRDFMRLKKLSISLTLVVTLLATLSAGKKLGDWEWIVPVISGFAALSTTLLSQTSAQKTWVHSRSVQQRLTVEKFLYLQDAGNYTQLDEKEKVRHFSNRVMEIWSEGHETWGQTVSEQKG
jgi:Protein of unknown function (DUF4231)